MSGGRPAKSERLIDIGIDQVSSRGHTNFSTGIPICSLWAWEGEGG